MKSLQVNVFLITFLLLSLASATNSKSMANKKKSNLKINNQNKIRDLSSTSNKSTNSSSNDTEVDAEKDRKAEYVSLLKEIIDRMEDIIVALKKEIETSKQSITNSTDHNQNNELEEHIRKATEILKVLEKFQKIFKNYLKKNLDTVDVKEVQIFIAQGKALIQKAHMIAITKKSRQ